MKFEGSLHGTTYRDPKEFAVEVKAADLKPKAWTLPAKPKMFVKPRVVLTAAEREWLGATVRRSDGAVGQVWALAPQSGHVWVVADGDFWFQVHTDALELVASRVDQLTLDL